MPVGKLLTFQTGKGLLYEIQKAWKKNKAFKLIRDEFALVNTNPSLPFFSELAKKDAYIDVDGSSYREEWCLEYRELCLKNYDLNMEYFSMLNKTDFDNSLEYTILKRDLDSNSHVNNLNYIDFAYEVLPSNIDIKELEISYLKESKLDDKLEIGCTFSNASIFLSNLL